MRSPGLAAVLASLLACAPDQPTTSATTGSTGTASSTGTGTSATATTATDPTTDDGGTVSASASASSTSSTATTASPTTSTSSATTGPAATTSSSTSSSTSDATSSTGTTGGPGGVCEPARGDYGPCDAELGWAYDGSACTLRSGCDCAPDCDKFFPDVAACALACADAGQCNPDKIEAAALAMDPVVEGSFCDGVYVCPMGDTALEQALEQIFGMLSCEPGGFPCDAGPVCAGLWAGMLGPEEWKKVCAASLVPMPHPLWCVVFGP